MIPGKYSGLVTCVAAAGMGMFVAMWLLDFALIRTNWCEGVEAVCFREWVSATSGWAAAAVAGFTAAIIIRQMYTSEQHHRENIARLEAPERSTAKQIIIMMMRIVAFASMINDRPRTANDDIYATDGQFYKGMYKQLKSLLDDPVFIRVQTMDVSLSAFYHKTVSDQLGKAIAACEAGLDRGRRSFGSGNEYKLTIERQQPQMLLNMVQLLHTSIKEAVTDRFPDMKV